MENGWEQKISKSYQELLNQRTGMIFDVLNVARWAPSYDNTQPWRFQIIDAHHAKIVSRCKSDALLLPDYKGNYTHFSVGCLLETISLAATRFGCKVEIVKSKDFSALTPNYDIALTEDTTVVKHPLSNCIEVRCTNRFPMSATRISSDDKKLLCSTLLPGWSFDWYEKWQDKFKIANIAYNFDQLAKPALRNIIKWNARFSEFSIPDESLGLDPISLALGRFFFESPKRLSFFRKYLAGDYVSAFTGFFVPALFCSAHVTFQADKPLESPEDYVSAGRCFQQYWLMASSLGIQLQMESGPIIFSRLVWDNNYHALHPEEQRRARQLEERFCSLFTEEKAKRIFMLARVGYAKVPKSRATRYSMEDLLKGFQE